jgi:GNAT superfamily N-acetyltransferase
MPSASGLTQSLRNRSPRRFSCLTQPYEITFDKSRMSVNAAHAFLSGAYWSPGVPLAVVQKAFDNSLCIAALAGGEQVGFVRVVTDKATFAYLADVYVLQAHRGKGLATRMVEAIQQHPELQGLRRFMLAKSDAHDLYAKFGFTLLSEPGRFMELHNPDAYAQGAAGVTLTPPHAPAR